MKNMKSKFLLIIVFLLLLTSCAENNPKSVFIDVLKSAKKGEKEKIINRIYSGIWKGDVMSDGTYLTPNETAELLVRVMKDRKIMKEKDIVLHPSSSDMFVLDYDDNEYINGLTVHIMMILYKMRDKFYISTIDINCGSCNGWKKEVQELF